VAALATLHLGPQCGDPVPIETANQVRFDTVSVDDLGGGAWAAWMDVVVESQEDFQSWEMTLSWDSGTLVLTQADPHPDFDDDGHLALEASSSPAGAGPFVDLRHGTPALGTVHVATLFFQSSDGAPTTLRVTGRAARPDGSLIPMSASAPVSLP
jgi:hypothetical protein